MLHLNVCFRSSFSVKVTFTNNSNNAKSEDGTQTFFFISRAVPEQSTRGTAIVAKLLTNVSGCTTIHTVGCVRYCCKWYEVQRKHIFHENHNLNHITGKCNKKKTRLCLEVLFV